MGAQANAAPVIIKRKKVVGGGGHHGGAWKVAYADFVTAMMAFFMLMWLLNATTETQRKGIADYFSPTIPVNRISGGGDGAFGGDSVFAEETLAQNGTGASLHNPTPADQARGTEGVDVEKPDSAEEQSAFEKIEDVLSAKSGESAVSEMMQRHIVTRVTDEGLIVELHDLDGEPLFHEDTAVAEPILVELVQMLARVFAIVPNDIAINGHTRTWPIVAQENPVWTLSMNRADQARGIFERQDFPADRVARVTGHADRALVVNNPMSPRNNRLEIILLREAR